MSETKTNTRVSEIFDLFYKHLNNFLKEANPNHEEYTEFVKWADRLGRTGELPLFMDVFIESSVLKNMYADKPGTEPSLLGPYYVEGAPILEKPYKLPMRENEKGEKLKFSGTVKDVNGEPLANTLVDMWQDDADGYYSSFDSDAPPYNLRGRFYTDENGYFEVDTIVPIPYQIPTAGPTGEFLKMIDQHPYRPAHLHIMFKHKGYETLITQVFFEGDEWLESDVADGVRPSLMTKLYDGGDYKKASLDFVMRNEE
ncbi:dioxygenase family protein [Piscibacillus halophilus]|uniref:Catechol 1,2-dioxygenase n=1 Tax=Piscibacillus halophilus TaxID=571933 RepID=A0A1H9B468_9BACI|nr:dioxygenase [Piscibacillus halophilus]SEP83463.1 catechol 1,2-dioxygenase [Piscibacillus halophilus]